MIKVLFFAQLAEFAERDDIAVEYAQELTPRSLVQSLQGQLPNKLSDALKHDVAMVAVNKKMIGWDDPLSDGDEVAFLPPFSGG